MTLQEFTTALAGLRNLPPLERAKRARTLIDEAKTVLSLERALAIAQARQEATGAEIGRQLGVTAQAVGKSDRLLLRRALEMLSRPGATSTSRQQTTRGLVDGTGLDVMARLVVQGARNLNRASISADEQHLIETAAARAAALVATTRTS